MNGLKNKTAVVTGGASGLGKAIAERLAAEGATVVITDMNEKAGEATASELGLVYLEHDVCDERAWSQLIPYIETHHGQLNILVNNAGIIGDLDAATPEDTSLASWRKVFSVNVEGVFLGCRTAIPAMRRSGDGSIINISSVAGLLATPSNTAYGASKAAVRQLTKSVAQYCADERLSIRCNSIHPGNVLTPLWQSLAEGRARNQGVSVQNIVARGRAESPMGEFVQPEDVAATVAFLASTEARYITGTELIVDGGLVNCDTYYLKKYVAQMQVDS